MVRLKVPGGTLDGDFGPSFNSNMVRLKAKTLANILFNRASFQFQYGTIKRTGAAAQTFGGFDVSIPIWYD